MPDGHVSIFISANARRVHSFELLNIECYALLWQRSVGCGTWVWADVVGPMMTARLDHGGGHHRF